MFGKKITIKDGYRGLYYEDGRLVRTLEAGHYELPYPLDIGIYRRPRADVVVVDVRQRDLTIKGQEILTADKVALRVSIVVQFRVSDPRAALHEVVNYEERLYTDVQLAARRSLASMNLEDILTNRNRLSEDILVEMKEAARGYGVAIHRADVKDLVFPGNLQEIMNRVLAAERNSQAQLVDARTKAEAQKIDADAKAHIQRVTAQAEAEAKRLAAEADAAAAGTYGANPALLRLRELEAMRELARLANARIYIGFDKHAK